MMRQRTPRDDTQSIDLSPLIDCVFLLLIFFMVTATFNKDMSLDINRPAATSATPASSKAIRIYIDDNGAIWLAGERVRPWMIQARLDHLLDASTSKAVLVVADGSISASRLIKVVDQARLAGAQVAVAPRRETGGSPGA